MKRIYSIVLAGLMLLLTGCHKDILNRLDDVEERVTNLETLCAQMNTNINALQTIVNALQTNDMITNVSEIKEGDSVIGYTITFLSGKSITIYNGKDGKNGEKGDTPTISAKQDTDGVYYWTVDGTWLLDADGNKIRVTGTTPKLKIEDGKWYVSYDGGTTWETEPVGQATGAKGDTGEKGEKGDSMFSSVDNSNDDYVLFTLADGITVIKIARYVEKDYYTLTYDANGGTGTMESEQISVWKNPTVKVCAFTYTAHGFIGWNTQANGTGLFFAAGESISMKGDLTLYAQWVDIRFSVSATQKVRFAPGNLQYQASTNTWRFAENQTDYIGVANNNISSTNTGWIDLFGWGTGANPTNTSTTNNDYATFTDWGTNVIGSDTANTWRTLTDTEWSYLFYTRANGNLYGSATVNGTKGIILLPDSWTGISGITFKSGTAEYTNNVYTSAQWQQMETKGAIFLPAAGRREGATTRSIQANGSYWSRSASNVAGHATYLNFDNNYLQPKYSHDRYFGQCVRLVQNL